MSEPRDWLPIIRNFVDRGMQYLLQVPEHARGLVTILDADIAARLDFARMESDPVVFPAEDMHQRETDMVLRVPYLRRDEDAPSEILSYLLLEHQSTATDEMGIRVNYGIASLGNRQRCDFDSRGVPIPRRRYRSVLPIVLHTGDDPWDMDISVTKLMDLPSGWERFQPRFDVLCLNVKAAAPERLLETQQAFGWILRVIQEEYASSRELEETLLEAVSHLTAVGKTEPVALERALIFLCLLMYHRRDVEEADELREKMVGAQPIRLREEVREVGQTAEQTIYERGRREEAVRARQETLLAQLSEKFGPVPRKVVEHVRALQDTEALDILLKRFAHAEHLDDMGL